MKLSFRPHHFLCTLGFQGKGYSPYFVENYSQIVESLQKNEETRIEVMMGNDSICKACPHQESEGCATKQKIQELDVRHAQILRLTQEDILSWREGKQRLKEQMTLNHFSALLKKKKRSFPQSEFGHQKLTQLSLLKYVDRDLPKKLFASLKNPVK